MHDIFQPISNSTVSWKCKLPGEKAKDWIGKECQWTEDLKYAKLSPSLQIWMDPLVKPIRAIFSPVLGHLMHVISEPLEFMAY